MNIAAIANEQKQANRDDRQHDGCNIKMFQGKSCKKIKVGSASTFELGGFKLEARRRR